MARGKSGPAVWISIQLRTRTPRPPAGGGRSTSCWFLEEAALGGVSSKLEGPSPILHDNPPASQPALWSISEN
jgi:hypothetical protein